MPSPCPQCGTLRYRRTSVRKNCGYDPGTAEAAAPAAPEPAAASPWPWPANCPRCGGGLNAGDVFCAHCGLDLRALFAPPLAPPAANRPTKLLVVGGIAAIAVLVLVGALIAVTRPKGGDASAEPSPSGTWQAFTCPDGSWSVMFPGSMTPRTLTQSWDTGYGTMSMTVYVVGDASAAYEAAAVDIPSTMPSGTTSLDDLQKGLFTLTGGTVASSRNLTVGSYEAREIEFSGMSAQNFSGYARFWVAGDRLYLLMVMAKPGTALYPEHFFDSFTMN
jgi:hypothetical protein